jgi:hypothetical protein
MKMIPNILKFRNGASITSLATLVASDSNTSLKSSDTLVTTIVDYNENLNSIVNLKQFDEIITNTLLDKTIDRFSLLNIKSDTQLNEPLKSFNDEIQTLRHIDSIIDNSVHEHTTTTPTPTPHTEQPNDELFTNLTLIQRDIMPIWSDVNKTEQNSICSILNRWQGIINSKFDHVKSKKKSIKQFELNENKYLQKGEFNYESNRTQMKKLQLDLFKSLGGTLEMSTDRLVKIKPNTRLILRAFKKLDDTLNCLENASKFEHDKLNTKLYWFNMSKFLQHTSKAVLRCALYVYENAHLNKCSLGSPPLYIIESDLCDEADVPYVKFETLYEYIYLCLLQLDTGNKENRRKNGHVVCEVESEIMCYSEIKEDLSYKNKKKLIAKYFTLMLNCLIRIVQLAVCVRDGMVMKQRVHSTHVYSYIIEHESKLFREYLKEILKIEE